MERVFSCRDAASTSARVVAADPRGGNFLRTFAKSTLVDAPVGVVAAKSARRRRRPSRERCARSPKCTARRTRARGPHETSVFFATRVWSRRCTSSSRAFVGDAGGVGAEIAAKIFPQNS
jgi:hypothetical protein